MSMSGLSPEEQRQLIVSVGTHRGTRALSPMEVSGLFEKALRTGSSVQECASAAQVETTQVSRFLALSKLPEDIQHTVSWGRANEGIAFSSAFEISRLDDAADQRGAAHAALEYGLSTSEVRQLVQARKRSRKPMAECVQSVIRMRPQVVVRHVLIGTVRDEAVKARLSALSQKDRDLLLAESAKALLKPVKASGRLGVSRFTIVGGEELGQRIRANKDELEFLINANLKTGLADG